MSNKIDLTKLQPEQLFEFKKQIQEEAEHFSSSLSALKTATAKYKECMDNVETINKSQESQSLLVPLSSSLYVPGKIQNNDKFLVDIGTNYFIEKDSKSAKEYFNSRLNKLNQDSGKLNELVMEKLELISKIDQILKQKIMEQQRLQLQQQQQQQQQQGDEKSS